MPIRDAGYEVSREGSGEKGFAVQVSGLSARLIPFSILITNAGFSVVLDASHPVSHATHPPSLDEKTSSDRS
jgi:hypothetical protein